MGSKRRDFWDLRRLLLLPALAGCVPPTIHDVEGRKVFNPDYLFYLESDKRAAWQRPEDVIKALGLQPTNVVADIGAGGGYFTERFAHRLPQGKVYATDVQTAMIERLEARVARQKLNNVQVIKAAFDDPSLPEASCHLAFLSSVYKEIQDRPAYMRKLRRCLKPQGRVVILEYRIDEKAPGPPPEMRLSPEEIVMEMEVAGFHLTEEYHFLPRENFLIFSPISSVLQ